MEFHNNRESQEEVTQGVENPSFINYRNVSDQNSAEGGTTSGPTKGNNGWNIPDLTDALEKHFPNTVFIILLGGYIAIAMFSDIGVNLREYIFFICIAFFIRKILSFNQEIKILSCLNDWKFLILSILILLINFVTRYYLFFKELLLKVID
jgi:hypothetical protein